MPDFEPKGTGVALVTPFTSEKEIDFDSLENHINRVIDNGVEFLVSIGTTGESATLSTEEKKKIIEFTAEKADGRVPVVAGVGGNKTADLVDFLGNYHFKGVDAILSVSPYYNKPSQEGLYQHYKALSEASPLPIILYNVPGRTSKNIEATTTLRLARDFDNIIAIKEASGDMDQIMNIIHQKPNDFEVLSGDDPLTLPMISCGANGVISVTANTCPHGFSEMVRQALDGNFGNARELHYELYDIIQLNLAEGNPAGVKASLNILGVCENEFRLPVSPISQDTYQQLEKAIKAYKGEKAGV